MAHAEYLMRVFKPGELRKTVDRVAWFIQASEVDYGFIAYSGQSGATMAAAVAYKLDKPLVCVRKPSDKNHSELPIEYDSTLVCKPYIIIDDLIASGNTCRFITSEIAKYMHSRCAAIFLYYGHVFGGVSRAYTDSPPCMECAYTEEHNMDVMPGRVRRSTERDPDCEPMTRRILAQYANDFLANGLD